MIPLNESSILEFSMSIQNSPNKLDKATLFIECNGFDIALPIVVESEDRAKVTLPILENIVPSGNRKVRMEMVLGGQVYTTFNDTMEFSAPPKIKVENTQISSAPAASFKVESLTSKSIVKPVEVSPAVEEVIENKYASEFAKLLETTFK
jgi:hypothetical protein